MPYAACHRATPSTAPPPAPPATAPAYSRLTALPKLMTIAFKETEMLLLLFHLGCVFRLFICLFLAPARGHTLHANGGVGNGTTGGRAGGTGCTASMQHMLPITYLPLSHSPSARPFSPYLSASMHFTHRPDICIHL